MGTLDAFLEKNGLAVVRRLAKGWSSEVYLAQDSSGRKFVLKVLRGKSNRKQMARRETENLRLANSAGIGPEWVSADFGNDIVAMEYIDGAHFSEWLSSGPRKEELKRFMDALFTQARKLDGIGLDHGQLAGRGRNILVRDGLPVIIDFEKASAKRKVHNVRVLESFLFRSTGSAVVKKVAEILG